LDKLHVRPQHIIVDGNKWKPYIPEGEVLEISARTVVKGDGKYLSIAAASVLAKTYRDEYMLRLHAEYPQYHWNTNMGYPTKAHYEAIRKYGITPYHRRSFKLEK
jgi:ribonuclease HII